MLPGTIKAQISTLIASVGAGILLAGAAAQAAFSVGLVPVATLEVNDPYGAVDITVAGDRAYLACMTAGFAVYDIRNPEAPQFLGMPEVGLVDYLTAVGDYAYSSLHNGDVKVVDVSDLPSAPVVFTNYLSSGESFAAGNYLYLVGANGGLRISNVQDPARPVPETIYYDLPSDALGGLHVQGDYAYATGGNDGLYIVNVANPASPSLVSTWNTSYSAGDVFVQGRYAYIGGLKRDENGLRIVDVSQPAAPRELPGYAWTIGEPKAVCVRNGLAFVGEHNWYGGQGQVTVFDVGNPAQPRRVGNGFADGYLRDLEVVGNYVFVAQSGNGFKVFRLELAGAVAPAITQAPRSVSVTAGQTAAFTTSATGDPVPRFQWQCSANGGADWVNLADGANYTGTDTTNLLVSARAAMNGYRFRALAVSVAGTNAGGAATLTASGSPLLTAQPQSRFALPTQSATLSVAAFGEPPLCYQWYFDHAPLAGATHASLVLTNLGTQHTGGYSVIVSNSYGAITSAVATLTIVPEITLPVALNAPTLTWTTGGTAGWHAQTAFQHDEFAAARSGGIPHGEWSWLETTVEGPGILSYWWKVSSEPNYDFLLFLRDGAVQASISGNVDWEQRTYFVPSGPHVLRWAYVKDWISILGIDAGWLDEVTFTRTGPLLAGQAVAGGNFTVTLETLDGFNYVVEYKDSLAQSNWTLLKELTGNGAVQVLTDTPTNAPQRFYRVRIP